MFVCIIEVVGLNMVDLYCFYVFFGKLPDFSGFCKNDEFAGEGLKHRKIKKIIAYSIATPNLLNVSRNHFARFCRLGVMPVR